MVQPTQIQLPGCLRGNMNPMSEWQNFYVILASAAAGLTGLQFVIMALIADMPLGASDLQAGEAFSTPTIVHFGAVAAVLAMPWSGAAAPSVLWGLAGVAGIAFTLNVARRMRAQSAYETLREDWFFRVAIPLIAYCVLAASAYAARLSLRAALFAVASVMLLLLFSGIHNAWDNVVYLVFVKKRDIG
jgi:hypothetical protein